jgi:hypothetical protein
MGDVYLFTWNLRHKSDAHDLAVDHLAARTPGRLVIACLQELPAASDVSAARSGNVASLQNKNLDVVRSGTVVPGVALVYHVGLSVEGQPILDCDGEFVAAVFRPPSSRKTVAVIGLHAKSKIDIRDPSDGGASRALLRHAINQLRFFAADHVVILGDFNSHFGAREMLSWHGFYALSGEAQPLREAAALTRRGFDHPPLHVVRPANGGLSTMKLKDSGVNMPNIIDFITVDAKTHANATSQILTTVSGTSVWDAATEKPTPSDHLPVEGEIAI